MAHLDVLEQAALVVVTRQGRHHTNHLNPVPIAQIHQRWMHPYARATANELPALKRNIERKERRPVVDDARTPIAVEIEAQVTIGAGVQAVWAALTDGVGEWWTHTFTDKPYAVVLEPVIGGRFYEQFDESGAGALYATVTCIEPGRVLRTSGPMGMSGARQYAKTYRLEPAGEATTVRTTASILGDVDPDTVAEIKSLVLTIPVDWIKVRRTFAFVGRPPCTCRSGMWRRTPA